MKKQKFYPLFVCILGITALSGSTLTFAGGASSRSSIDLSNPDVKEQYLQIVLKNGKYKFAHPELKENKIPESMWESIAAEIGVTLAEFYKIKKGKTTTRKIVLGTLIYNHYKNTQSDNAYSDEDRLLMLKQAADHGSEWAIKTLLDAYKNNKLGLDSNDPKIIIKRIKLVQKYQQKGSEHGTHTLIDAYFSGITGND